MKSFIPVLLIAASVVPASAQGVPKLDYRSTCKATPAVGMDRAATVASCLADEENARGALPAVWAKSSKASRAACVAETSQGGLPSYVELLTCLQGNLAGKAG